MAKSEGGEGEGAEDIMEEGNTMAIEESLKIVCMEVVQCMVHKLMVVVMVMRDTKATRMQMMMMMMDWIRCLTYISKQ